MIRYDPGRWSILFAFSLRGSVFPRSFVFAFPCAVLSAALHYIFNTVLKEESIKNSAGDASASILGGFYFTLGFLIVFRSQQAYSRWWEGGTLMQQIRGEWFNAFSCLMAFSTPDPEKQAEVQKFQHHLVRLISLLYASALSQVSTTEEDKFELFHMATFSNDSLEFLFGDECHDRCEVVMQWVQSLIVDGERKGLMKIAPPILSRTYQQLGNGIVNLNNARKITDFPIPFPLSQMIAFMLFFHWAVTPVICATAVATWYWAFILSFVVSFSFWSINYIAVELEQPFGNDENDLPLTEMQEDFNKSLRCILHKHSRHIPSFEFDMERHEKLETSVVDLNKFNFAEYKAETMLMLKRKATMVTPDDGHFAPTGVVPAASSCSAAPASQEQVPLVTASIKECQQDTSGGAGAGAALRSPDKKPTPEPPPGTRGSQFPAQGSGATVGSGGPQSGRPQSRMPDSSPHSHSPRSEPDSIAVSEAARDPAAVRPGASPRSIRTDLAEVSPGTVVPPGTVLQ